MALENTDLFVLQKDDTKYNVTLAQLRLAISGNEGKVYLSPDPPPQAVVGELWWESDTGIMYVYYEDPTQDTYWVATNPQGTPNAGFVSVSKVPPVSPEEGALWWKDDEGIMYVYYTDPSGDQYWVDTNPSGTGGGSGGTGGAIISDTAPGTGANGQLWWDSGSGVMYIWYDDGDSGQWVVTDSGYFPDIVSSSRLNFNKNYANLAAAPTGQLGDVAVIGGKLCFHDGTSFKEITLGAAPA